MDDSQGKSVAPQGAFAESVLEKQGERVFYLGYEVQPEISGKAAGDYHSVPVDGLRKFAPEVYNDVYTRTERRKHTAGQNCQRALVKTGVQLESWRPDGLDGAALVGTYQTEAGKYLYHFLRASKEYLESIATGTTFKELSGTKIAELNIPLPPLPEQERIAARLDLLLGKLKAARKSLDAVPDLVKRFRKSVLAQAVSGKLTEEWRAEQGFNSERENVLFDDDSQEILSSWQVFSLESLIDPLRPLCYGVVQPGDDNEYGKVKMIRVQDIENGRIKTENLRSISNEIDLEYRRSRVIPGDLLISVVGTIGRMAIVPAGFTGNIARAVARVRCNSLANARFAECWLSSDIIQRFLIRSSREVARKTLNLSELSQTAIALPSLPE